MVKKAIVSVLASVVCVVGLLMFFSNNDDKLAVVEAKTERKVYTVVEQQGIDYQKQLAKDEQEYVLTFVRNGKMDGEDILLYRFQPKTTEVNLYKEHFSVVLTDKGGFKGFKRMNADLAKGSPLSKEEARAKAEEFLQVYAPDLLSAMKLQWIDLHDEFVQDASGQQVKLTGMKVKCLDTRTGLYFWVILANDGSVMVFERDIYWDFERSGRRTEKFLHDSWLDRNGF